MNLERFKFFKAQGQNVIDVGIIKLILDKGIENTKLCKRCANIIKYNVVN